MKRKLQRKAGKTVITMMIAILGTLLLGINVFAATYSSYESRSEEKSKMYTMSPDGTATFYLSDGITTYEYVIYGFANRSYDGQSPVNNASILQVSDSDLHCDGPKKVSSGPATFTAPQVLSVSTYLVGGNAIKEEYGYYQNGSFVIRDRDAHPEYIAWGKADTYRSQVGLSITLSNTLLTKTGYQLKPYFDMYKYGTNRTEPAYSYNHYYDVNNNYIHRLTPGTLGWIKSKSECLKHDVPLSYKALETLTLKAYMHQGSVNDDYQTALSKALVLDIPNAKRAIGENTLNNSTFTISGPLQNFSGTTWVSGYTDSSGNRFVEQETDKVEYVFELVPKNYSVIANANGGTITDYINSSGATTTSTVVPVQYDASYYDNIGGLKPSRAGWAFTGWYDQYGNKVWDADGKAVNGTGYWSGGKWIYDGNLTVYAHWEQCTTWVVFDANWGNLYNYIDNTLDTYNDWGNYTTAYLEYGRDYYDDISRLQPTRPGFTFDGWYTDPDNIQNGRDNGTQVWDANGIAVAGTKYGSESFWEFINGDYQWKNKRTSLTVFAHWVPEGGPYKLTVDSNGGTWNGYTTPQTYSLYTGDSKSIPDPSRLGYRFAGWSPSGSVNNQTFTMGSSSVTITAQWTPVHTLTVNPNGGTWNGSASVQSFRMTEGETKYISDPSWVGHTFVRWQPSITNRTFMMGGSDTTLTAVWDINSYQVTLTAGTGISSVSGGGSKQYGSSVTISAALKTGYHWKNWTGTLGTVNNQTYTFTMPANDVTMTANGEANTYTIKFNGNGATGGSTADMSCTYDVSVKLNANGFTKTGNSFAGWNTKADGSGTSYKNQESVKNLTSTNKGTVTLYAQWKVHSSTLKINPNGGTWNGSASVQSFTQNYNTTKKIQEPTRVGYTFVGWKKSSPFYGNLSSATGTATYTFGAADNVTDTLTAQWQLNYYNVNLTAGYGIESVSAAGTNVNGEGKFGYGSSVTITAKELAGFHWVNWTGTLGTVSNQTYTFTMPANDVTMTANGEANNYTIQFHPNDGATVAPIPDRNVKYDETVTLPNGTPNYVKYTLNGANVTSDVLAGNIAVAGETGDAEVLSLDETEVQTVQDNIQELENELELLRISGEASEEDVIHLEAELGQLYSQLAEYSIEAAALDETEEAYPSVFTGWSLETDKTLFVPSWKANEEMNVAAIVDAAGLTLENNAVITLYAIWDDCPWIMAEDLYFTLEEAQTGFITYDELMSHASASDREDGSVILPGEDASKGTSFVIIDYAPTDFTQFVHEGSVTETYRVKDSAGSVYKKMITVHIVDTTAAYAKPEGTTRFINEKYYYETFERGGLEENSIWKTDPDYISVIEQAFENSRNDTPVISFYFTHEEILNMKAFVQEHGIGKFQEEDALQRFYEQFMEPNIVDE